jgi:hypothetical protein
MELQDLYRKGIDGDMMRIDEWMKNFRAFRHTF